MLSLAERPKHGYAIMKDIENFSDISMSPGTLYGAIARLDGRGWIREIQTKNYRRRPFRLTSTGMQSLREHLLFLEKLSGIGLRRIGATSIKQKGALSR
jgi:DNA-binding PadR family transcriptional regulator